MNSRATRRRIHGFREGFRPAARTPSRPSEPARMPATKSARGVRSTRRGLAGDDLRPVSLPQRDLRQRLRQVGDGGVGGEAEGEGQNVVDAVGPERDGSRVKAPIVDDRSDEQREPELR